MADPKTTNRFVSTDSKFDFYANVISHAELYANNISANSFNVGSQTLEEYIQSVGGGGGSGDVTNNYVTATFVSNNYLEDIKSTFGTGDVTNNYLTATFSSNNYIQDVLDTKATNTYLTATFSSNNYIQDVLDTKATNTYVNSTFSSNNYIQDVLDTKATNTYVNSTFTSNNYVDGRFTSNSFVKDTFTSNNYVQDHFIRSDQADTKTANLNFSDNVRVTFGDDGDFEILHNGINTQLNNHSGTLQIIQRVDDLDAVIYTDDGSGGITEYVRADGSTGEVILSHYGTHKLSTKSTGIDVSGSITVSGTVDGRDIASDGSTLDSISSTYASNNYLVATFASNNYLQDRLTAFGSGDVSNNYLINHFTTNNYIQTYVSSEISSLVDSAPTTLDTLNELAAALGDDPNFATTVTNQIGIRATNTYVNATFSSNNYVTGNFVSNNYLTAGQISNINVSQLQVGEEDSAAGGVLTVYGRQTGETVGGEIRLHTAADHDTNIPYYAIKTSGEDFVIELNGGTDVITIDYSTGAVDVPTGRVDLGLSDNTYGELRLYGNGTGSSQGGLIRMYTAADYDSSIDFFNMKVTADDWHLEKGTGEDILSYFGGSNELRFGSTLAYVSVGASDSSKGSLYLWSDGTGSVDGGELRIYNAPDHDTNVNYYSIYAESGDLLISYGSTDFLQYDETASQWLMPQSGGLDVTGDITTSGLTLTSTDDTSAAGPELILYRNSSSPDDGDYLGQIQFKGRNDGNADEIYAKVTGKIRDVTNGTEDGLIETAIKGDGSFVIVSRQRSDELQLLNGVGLYVNGSITVDGTVDGRDVNGDGTTLDAISSTYVSNNYFQDNAGGGATGGGSDKIFFNNDQTVTTSYTIPTGQNSMTAGPISINSGVTVTVPSGSEWTIV